MVLLLFITLVVEVVVVETQLRALLSADLVVEVQVGVQLQLQQMQHQILAVAVAVDQTPVTEITPVTPAHQELLFWSLLLSLARLQQSQRQNLELQSKL
jgi:uncharacterized membrane-anchored protein